MGRRVAGKIDRLEKRFGRLKQSPYHAQEVEARRQMESLSEAELRAIVSAENLELSPAQREWWRQLPNGDLLLLAYGEEGDRRVKALWRQYEAVK